MTTNITNNYSYEKREECGIVGIYSKKGSNVAPLLHRALVALQHRGQDAAGFAVFDGEKIELRRGLGLVERIFVRQDMELEGYMGIGHTRYPTIGECKQCDVQPTVYEGIATAHNGHIANYDELKNELRAQGYKFESTVDAEPMTFFFHRSKTPEDAVKDIMKKMEGAYSDVTITNGKLYVFRDPYAIRPLVWGENEDCIMFASETAALDTNGIPYKGNVLGGELVIVDKNGMVRKQLVKKNARHCMFEYVYFSRPDSSINGKSVYEVRKLLGGVLARESPVDADVVVAVPDTARVAASTYASALKLPFEEGLIKNRYIGRTFIMPSQEQRIDAVRLKLNPIREVVNGKRVVLIDDSIVRGTTLKEIIKIVRGAGATEVHIRITCPPVKAPCFYGVDMKTYSELIANKKNITQISEYLGADSLAYISIEGLKESIGQPICTACLNEDYHTDFVRLMAKQIKARGMDKEEGGKNGCG